MAVVLISLALLLMVLAYLEGASPSRVTRRASNRLLVNSVFARWLKIVLVALVVLQVVMYLTMGLVKADVSKEKPPVAVPTAGVEGTVRQLPSTPAKPAPKYKIGTPMKAVVPKSPEVVVPPVQPEPVAAPDKNVEIYRKICQIYRSC